MATGKSPDIQQQMQRREEMNINVHRDAGRMLSREMISDDEYRAGQTAGSAGNYYTDKDNYYVLGSWENAGPAGGLNSWGCRAVSIGCFYPSSGGKAAGRRGSKPLQDGSNKHRPGYDLTFSAPKVSP